MGGSEYLCCQGERGKSTSVATACNLISSHLILSQFEVTRVKRIRVQSGRSQDIHKSITTIVTGQSLTDILASTDITRLTTGSRTTLFTEPKPKRRLITEFSTPAHQARQ
jgi:hypothetical protein